MFIRSLLLVILLIPSRELTIHSIKTIKIEHYQYQLNKDSVNNYPLSEVMAAIAYHECFNLSQEERFLVMEAFLNRVEDNFNSNGNTVKEQLLAPKQFTGLWKYSPQQFKYDSFDTLCIQNKEMATAIINGYRIAKERIYYWAGECDRKTKHGKWVKKQKLLTSKNIITWFR